MSKTPITDKAEQHWTNAELETGGSVYASDMRALELAANGLAVELRFRMDQLESIMGDRSGCQSDALTAFAALQPSPHDAPRTETHP